jgi:MFS family permease
MLYDSYIFSALINKVGNRMVTFCGLLLMCIAVLSITFTTEVYILFVCYAIFGIGNGMIHLAGMVICSSYFEKAKTKLYIIKNRYI